MAFELRKYTHPDFAEQKFIDSPDCRLEEAPKDGVVPFDFHALSIFPEYFKINGDGCSVKRAEWTQFQYTMAERCSL